MENDQELNDNNQVEIEDEGDYMNLDLEEENLENIENNEKPDNIEKGINVTEKENKNKEDDFNKNTENSNQNDSLEELKDEKSEKKIQKEIEEEIQKKNMKIKITEEENLTEEIREEKLDEKIEEQKLEEEQKKLVENKEEKNLEKEMNEKKLEDQNLEEIEEKFSRKRKRKKSRTIRISELIEEERLLSNFKDNWIELIKLSYPKEKPGFFKSYMVYEIEFKIKDESFKIYRRFSDFENLRNTLKKFVPCVYIKNVHKKKIFNNKNANFILERVNSLETFLNFLLSKKELFNTEPFWIFFNPEKKESDVSDDLKIISRPRISSILENYINIYPEYEEDCEIKKNSLRKIKKFKQKVEINIEFYQQLSDMACKIVLQNGENEKNQLESFYNSIIIPFGKNIETFKKLKDQCDKIHKINLQEFIINFQKEIEKISLEFSAFLDLFDDFETCQKLFNDKKNKIILLKKNLSDIKEPENGDISDRVEKEIEIKKMEYEINKNQMTLNKIEKLFEIFIMILIEIEIPFIKRRKKINYAKNLNVLAHQKFNLFNEQIAFWEDLEKLTDC